MASGCREPSIPEESSAPYIISKRCKISIFQPNHFGPSYQHTELLLHKEDFPGLCPGDVVEIYHPENEATKDLPMKAPRLLLMVDKNGIYPDNGMVKPLNRETVNVEKSVAETFQLPNYKDVIVTKVDKKDITLDSVELTFKEQYIGRSEMWRLKKSLADTCVYLNKKVDLCQGQVRCQVNEMWGQGYRVSSGVITPDTKVVFRSDTAMVYLFIQMSSEMWDFDIHGELFFEKAVDGFLAEMFERWKESQSSHEVTIILFSRCFYAAKDKSQFPERMQDCLQIGYNNCFYEDFYRVVVQNERFDDWSPTVRQLKQIFTHYKKYILDYHKTDSNETIPMACISSAAQGNFLEVLNMSLNTFEHHYLNRNLDRTGQQSIVITPGVGIFEVDRELTMITKQRIIDSGVGSDLICVGEQPLHAVPLFKYHHKNPTAISTEDYSMPHWINLSFYSKGKKVGYSNFMPRITIPRTVESRVYRRTGGRPQVYSIDSAMIRNGVNPVTVANNDVFQVADAYDVSVFELPTANRQTRSSSRDTKRKMSDPELRTTMAASPDLSINDEPSRPGSIQIPSRKLTNHNDTLSPGSDPVFSSSLDSTAANNLNFFMNELSLQQRRASLAVEKSGKENGANLTGFDKSLMGSIDTTFDHQAIKKYLLRPGRALINPFDPSHTTIRLTSNRRRWTHIFPKGPTGQHQQAHHVKIKPQNNGDLSDVLNQISTSGSVRSNHGVKKKKKLSPLFSSSSVSKSSSSEVNKDHAFLWSATGEQVWSASQQTGVDWKSLTIPASLPITTDYCPDPKSLVNDYVFNEYEMIPQDVFSDMAADRSPLEGKNRLPTTEEIFTQLISQRLAQGFQLILLPPTQEEAISNLTSPASPCTALISPALTSAATSRSFTSKLKLIKSSAASSTPSKKVSAVLPQAISPPAAEFWMSIGRIFHKISLSANKSKIMVTRYRPRRPYQALNIHYRYRFGAPDNDNYEVSWVDFRTEKLEHFNWNHMDFYVVTRGDKEFLLTENLKYWRFRFYALPLGPYIPFTKKIVEAGGHSPRCDIYQPVINSEVKAELTKGFVRLLEACLNRIRKPLTNVNLKRPCSMQMNRTGEQRQRSGAGFREHRANTISSDRSQVMMTAVQNRLRHPSGGQGGSSVTSIGHLSPEQNMRGSTSSVDQNQVGSFETHISGPGGHRSHSGHDLDQDDAGHQHGLKLTSTLHEIMDAMKASLNFVNKTLPAMPPSTFVAFEAVSWIMENVEGASSSEVMCIKILKNMQDKGYICHTSGNAYQPFVNGFHFFSLNPNPRSSIESAYGGNLDTFRNDWVEVEFLTKPDTIPNNDKLKADADDIPEFLHDTMSNFTARERIREKHSATETFYKSATFDVDISNRSDREEWGHMKYQHYYNPTEAFDIAVQWSVATGAIISDLVHGWARKSQQYGISFIPVPSDPFALPITTNSDPVRGPIFIELDTECLRTDKSFNLFEAFPESTWDQRMFLFREAIAQRFGFITCTTDRTQQPSSALFSTDHQYIHCTGNMFLLIPTQQQLFTGIQVLQGMKSRPSIAGFDSGSLQRRRNEESRKNEVTAEAGLDNEAQESFTRHLSQAKPAYDHSKTGFLWSWNFTISRKWKMTSNTGATGDIAFMDNMLADFRAFCRNDDNRLKNFWQECWDTKRSQEEAAAMTVMSEATEAAIDFKSLSERS